MLGNSFGPLISWSIFDYAKIHSRINAADAKAGEALSIYQSTVLKALEETENALGKFSSEKKRRQSLIEAVAASSRAFELAKTKYDVGATGFLDVLVAQRTALQDEEELARSDLALNSAVLSIYKALGGGWEGYSLKEA